MLRRGWLILLVALSLVLLLQVPYVLGYATAPPETMYTGLLINVEDANYITIIQRGSEGAWMHSLRFTSEQDTPPFLYVFYLALGHVACGLNVDTTTMWHLARVGMTLLVLGITFGFVKMFMTERRAVWTAFLLAALGAGFDWFVLPWETVAPTAATPADLKMADAHLFSAMLTFPHYLASIACLLILFWCVVRLLNETLTRRKILALVVLGAAANLGVGLVYPFFILLSCGVLVLYALMLMLRARKILWRKVLLVAVLCAAVVPLGAYYAYALASSELLRVWAAQSQTLSPNVLHYGLTFAPYLFFALWGLWRVGSGDDKRLLLWAWLLTVALLVYAPLGAQRRFLQGVQIPLAILATCGLFEVALPRVQRTRWFQALAQRPDYSAEGLTRMLIVGLIFLVSMSSAYQWVSAIALTTTQQPYPLFRPREEVAAMDWLRGRASVDDVILSSYYSGSYLPYRSGARVYLGHYYETIHFDAKQTAVENFFDGKTSDATRVDFLRANGISFLFYGRVERAAGTWNPAMLAGLQSVYENGDVVIYRFVR